MGTVVLCLSCVMLGFAIANHIRLYKAQRLLRSLNPRDANSMVELDKIEAQLEILRHFNYFMY